MSFFGLKVGSRVVTFFISVLFLYFCFNSLGRKTNVLESGFMDQLQELYPQISEESTLTMYVMMWLLC